MNEEDVITCHHCGIRKQSKDFFKSKSAVYAGSGVLPVCKKCLKELYNLYCQQYLSSKLGMQRICAAFDLYWNENLFLSTDKGNDTTVSAYLKALNTTQYKNKTFDDSLLEGFYFSGDSQEAQAMVEADNINPSLVEKWGIGLKAEEYEMLDNHYKELKRSNDNLSNNQLIYIDDLCRTNLLKIQAFRRGDTKVYNECCNSYMKTFKDAGLSLKTADMLNENDTWGTLIERCQKYTPAEYYKDKSLFKDFDSIEEYVKRFVFRPIKNLITGESERDPEFNVEDADMDEQE